VRFKGTVADTFDTDVEYETSK